MDFLESRIAILERSPAVLRALLAGLPDELARAGESKDSWSGFVVVGHLVHGEKTDWLPRLRIILDHGEGRAFETFDRFAQFEESRGKSLDDLLTEFAALRAANLATLRELNLGDADRRRRGRHPALGTVTLGELLTTWAVHDLAHLAQIARSLAMPFREEVGPWRAYLRVLE